jgi:hypothetical protein
MCHNCCLNARNDVALISTQVCQCCRYSPLFQPPGLLPGCRAAQGLLEVCASYRAAARLFAPPPWLNSALMAAQYGFSKHLVLFRQPNSWLRPGRPAYIRVQARFRVPSGHHAQVLLEHSVLWSWVVKLQRSSLCSRSDAGRGACHSA